MCYDHDEAGLCDKGPHRKHPTKLEFQHCCPNGCKAPGTNLWTPGMVGADPLAKLEPTTAHKIWLDLYDGNGHFGPYEVECPCPLHREQGSDETSLGEQSSAPPEEPK